MSENIERNIKSRIVHKHDVEANWKMATTFVPKQGEIIIYDKDATCDYERVKIGDGSTLVSNLPFIEASFDLITTSDIDLICGETITIVNANETKF